MKYVVDLHTHSIVSGHAYTTLLENIKQASLNGIKVLGTSEHGPKMPGGPHIYYFGNMRNIPRELYGVKILRGCEANIIDREGNIDLPEEVQEKLDYIIASLHDPCIDPGTIEENTKAVINVMNNKRIDILGHLGNPTFPIDKETVVKKAKATNTIIELNNGSLTGSREGSMESCIEIAELCKKNKVKVILSTDAHICFKIGKFEKAQEIVRRVNMPEELIVNNDENKIFDYLKAKGKLINI
ncbi:phosphatase [Clostridium guangxiense]|uniref:phosphatase n=1 Tax=Clostridium guangxiense TaxID=1662055 RepID=UPI001E2B6891|nr:phosphatase [Clostridium guangxiense]MCD2346336.1 phosphatase [Clostridium guangxiense]